MIFDEKMLNLLINKKVVAMLLSMTGFGKGIASTDRMKYIVEIKSLNSKQLDLVSRIPSAYRDLEGDIRNAISEGLHRGKVEVSLTVEHIGTGTDTTLDLDRLVGYKAQVEEMGARLGLPAPNDWYSLLLRFPEVFHSNTNQELPEEEKVAIFQALNSAIIALIDFRQQEGAKLADFFRMRIANIRALLDEVPNYEVERLDRIRNRMEEALKQIPFADYDRGRYEQEMIFYIEKLDITEEKQRLSQHLNYFLETLDASAGQGKKLGFISQEMGREINTLGSKSNHAEMQILVVKMKDELEQIKEQVLNAL